MGVAQLVEPRIVTPVVVGSIPIAHPIPTCACKGKSFKATEERLEDDECGIAERAETKMIAVLQSICLKDTERGYSPRFGLVLVK